MRLGQKPLELAVFRLEYPQTPGIRHLHAAVLGFPAVEALLGDPMTARDLLHRRAGLLLTQDPNDLFLRESPLHRKSSFLGGLSTFMTQIQGSRSPGLLLVVQLPAYRVRQ
jgi:hypothetical protein